MPGDGLPGPPSADMLADLSDDELHRLMNDLQAIMYTREATRRQTQLEHHPGEQEEDG